MTITTSLAEQLCRAVDWARPDLTATTACQAWQRGDCERAALALVRHLRERSAPSLGFTSSHVAMLREHTAPATRETARAQVAKALDGLSGHGPARWDSSFCGLRPEILQVGADTPAFERFAGYLTGVRELWPRSPIHTILGLLRYLQAVWPLAECPDHALVPPLAFLAEKLPQEWAWARTWGEAMLGTEGHNWYVAQFGAHWMAGHCFPEFLGFARFQALYPTWFDRELLLLMRPDGFSRECSVAYHLGTVDLFLMVARLAERNGLPLSPAARQRLQRCAEVEWQLMPPDGTHPIFGDCIMPGRYLLQRARSLAAMLDVPELKYLAETLDPQPDAPHGPLLLEALYYPGVGEDLRPAYDRLTARAPALLDCALRDSGYYAMRQDWTAQADYAAIEASARGTLVTSHGQGAIFDLILFSRGRAITTGNGKGPCGSPAPERTWRVSTAGHTAASVDDLDHVPLRSVYRFERVVTPVVDDWQSAPDYAYFSGAHEAYERLEQKVPGARRKLFYRRGAYFILIDRFTAGSPEHTHVYRQHYQMAVPTALLPDGRARTLGAGGNLLFCPVPGAAGRPSLGPCPYPLPDHPNPGQLVFSQTVTGHALFVTILVPFLDDAVPAVTARLLPVFADERQLSPWEATGLELLIDGQRELYVDVHMQWNLPWTCGGAGGAGRLYHSQCPTLAP